MAAYSTFDQLQRKVVSRVSALVMAAQNQRAEYEQFLMTVARAAPLGPHVRRVTFHAPEFRDWATSGPDEYFGLLIPPPGAAEVTLPSPGRINVRAALQRLPAHARPDLRWYTVRALRGRDAEIDVDFVLHDGTHGPGSTWARTAEPGAVVGFRACGSAYRGQPAPSSQLLVADETALPALSAILESLPADAGHVQAIAEVPDESYELPIGSAVPVEFVHRGTAAPGSLVLAAARIADLDYAWVCGESGMATAIRGHLVRQGVDRRRVLFSGYWRRRRA
ncbi:siderophore-interacting protein [Actinokineospora sp.]|uniref:siderophore-interacting protein n=1 Tax=Actinokineospora sp. TaxID=1872133 RepID=UPI004038271A